MRVVAGARGDGGCGARRRDTGGAWKFRTMEIARFSEILLIEDNSNASERQRRIGVAEGSSNSITVKVHRFNGAAPAIAAAKTYRAGTMRQKRSGRIDLAVRLLERAGPSDSCVVVAGTSYGATGAFVQRLAELELPFVLRVRPSTKLTVQNGRNRSSRSAGDLLAQPHRWSDISASLPDGTVVDYAGARLAKLRLPCGTGWLFAARVGGVQGAERTTIIGVSSFDAPLSELVRLVEHARWIRPTTRKRSRAARGPVGGAEPTGSSAVLRARANIALAKKHDQARRDAPASAAALHGALRAEARSLNVVELFAGAGGMGLGFLHAASADERFRIVYSGEANPIYVETLRRNHATAANILGGGSAGLVPAATEPVDLRSRKARQGLATYAKRVGGADVLIGGPPCQGFSMANRNSWHGRNANNRLVDVFLQYVKALQPRVFLMENVQGILWTPKGRTSVSVVDGLEKRMRSLGYVVFPKLLDAVWYGVPQHRTRFFLLGLHRDLGYDAESFGEWGPFPLPSHGEQRRPYVTVAKAIRDLPPIGNGERRTRMAYRKPPARERRKNGFLAYVTQGAPRGAVLDHVTSRHADYVIERYRKIPPGGNWEDIKDELTNYADVSRTHSNIYRRLRWDEPSITIGHYRKSMLVHPEQVRGLSLREAARLQSFPDWFCFAGAADGGAGGLVHKQQQLANAVCPLVTKAIAEFLFQL